VKRAERVAAILDVLGQSGSLGVADLSERFGVSAATVRRDLQVLEEQRLLSRTHGGALAENVAYELPMRYRDGYARDAKRLIAREAVRRLPGGGCVVGLTGGTTTTEVARCIADRSDLTVVTNAINIGALLAVRPRAKLILTGGVARPQSYELVGPLAEATLGRLNIEVAFIGVNGIDAEGLTTYDEVEAHTNAKLIERASRKIVIADGSKVGRVRLAHIAKLNEIDELITDESADPIELQSLRDAGLVVTVVR
jgi:DeoR family transcriptional regulator, aga operon transcriptional repressor